ncbi:MAG: redox-sensing transcriptional repressor Rex [Clostridia bacterium]|nr:redox-sensing transcriptional repressor Rex [Clostridia bacterium]
MKTQKEISASVISRLPRYYRFLCDLYSNGQKRISSKELADIMGFTASQIRQDFNCFGGFGQQGYGYNIEQLIGEFAGILGLNKLKTAILIGAGNLGRAVASQMSFEDKGFKLIGIFDCDPLYKGIKIRDIPISADDSISDFCTENKPDMAVLCLPADKAPDMVDLLISLGVKSFWNFSHYDIHRKYPAANVENVHLSDSLMTLSFIIKNSDTGENYD